MKKFKVMAIAPQAHGGYDWQVVGTNFDSQAEAQSFLDKGKKDNRELTDWTIKEDT